MKIFSNNQLLIFFSVLVSMLPLNSSIGQIKSYFKEQVEIVTDRSIYFTTEEIQIKSFTLNAFTQEITDLSSTVYIELLTENNIPIEQITVKQQFGSGIASLKIPDTLSSGNYWLRAYTNWMKNESANEFFHRPVAIINPLKSFRKTKIQKDKPHLDSIDFFPEGDILIENKENILACKLYDQYYQPFKGDVSLRSIEGDSITTKTADKTGNVIFNYIPKSDQTYQVVNVHSPNEAFIVPKAFENGYKISLNEKVDDIKFTLKIDYPSDINFSEPISLYYKKAGVIKYIKDLNPISDTLLPVLWESIPEGVSTFFLKGKNNIVSSRVVFKPREIYSPVLRLNKATFGPREKVEITIDSIETLSNQEICITVIDRLWTDHDFFEYSNNSNYLVYLSTIPIQDANNLALIVREQLNQVSEQKDLQYQFLPEINGTILQGKLTDANNNILTDNMLSFGLVGKNVVLQLYKTDKNGQFSFSTDFSGSREIVLHNFSKSDQRSYIEINSNYSEKYSSYKLPVFHIDTSIHDLIRESSITAQINSIYPSKAVASKKSNSNIDSQRTLSSPNYSFKVEDYIQLASINEFIREVAFDLTSSGEGSKINSLQITNKLIEKPFNEPPLILIDGAPVKQYNNSISLNHTNIETVQIWNRNYFLGNHRFNGVVHFITTEGKFKDIKMEANLYRHLYEGYTNYRPFPAWIIDSKHDNRTIPDRRNTLYWSPKEFIGPSGLTTSFYTSDTTGEFIILIRGIGKNGEIIKTQIPFKVE